MKRRREYADAHREKAAARQVVSCCEGIGGTGPSVRRRNSAWLEAEVHSQEIRSRAIGIMRAADPER